MYAIQRPGNEILAVYEYRDEQHRHRIGHCEFKPKDGDLCLCFARGGDCFNHYFALRKNDNGKYQKVGKFGAYMFGEKIHSFAKTPEESCDEIITKLNKHNGVKDKYCKHCGGKNMAGHSYMDCIKQVTIKDTDLRRAHAVALKLIADNPIDCACDCSDIAKEALRTDTRTYDEDKS